MSERIVSIHQPNYLPWLGFVAKIATSDVFIVLDDVQYSKNNWQNRTRYSTNDGLKFLTLPVCTKGVLSEQTPISEILLANRLIPKKHFKTLHQRYGKCAGWKLLSDRLEKIFCREYEKMIDLSWATIQFSMEAFRLKPEIHFASKLPSEGQKTDRVLSLTQSVKGTHYISGAGAKVYLHPESFQAQGVSVSFQEFTHPEWKQTTSRPFEPAAFALEWILEEGESAIEKFHAHLRLNSSQPPRCLLE